MSKEYNCSPSKIGCAQNCELQFYLRYVKHIYMNGFVYPALVIGTVFHKCMEWMYVRRKFELKEILGFVDEAWSLAMKDKRNKLRPEHLTSAKILEHKTKVKKLIERFYNNHEKEQEIEVRGEKFIQPKLIGIAAAGVEQNVRISWTTSKGLVVALNGYIDRVMVFAKKAWITDWKTTKDIPEQSEVDSSMQLTFYSAFYRYLAKNRLEGNWPKTEDYLELFFPVIGKSITTTRGKKHFDDMKNGVEKVIDMEIKQSKKAMPSAEACKWCEFRSTTYCPDTMGVVFAEKELKSDI